jgi:hypothetical protein
MLVVRTNYKIVLFTKIKKTKQTSIEINQTICLPHFWSVLSSLCYLISLQISVSQQWWALRQCVPLTFSKSDVFSGKWDPEPGNSGAESPVDFRSGKEVRNLVFFESPKIGPKISPKISPKINQKMTKFGLFWPVRLRQCIPELPDLPELPDFTGITGL